MTIIIKKAFSLKMLFKSYGVIYVLRQRQRPYCVFTLTVASPYAKEANE